MCLDDVPESCGDVENQIRQNTRGMQGGQQQGGLSDYTYDELKMFTKNKCPELPNGR